MKKAIYLIAIAAAGLLAGCTGIAKFDYATAPGTMVVLQEKGIKLEYDDEVARSVAHGSFSEKYGARNMRRYIQKNIEDKLAEQIISDHTASITLAKLSVDNGEIAVSCI